MKKYITLILTVGLCLWGQSTTAQSSLQEYQWEAGINLGTLNYQGDLSYGWRSNLQEFEQLDITSPSSFAVGLHLAHRLAPSWELGLQATWGTMVGNDRTVDSKGNLDLANPNFSRSLNFQTEIMDLAALLRFRFDNGRLLNRNARFSPYLTVGVGVTHFDVFGDLLSADGSRYYYWSDNSIRDLAENDPNAASASLVNQDLQYETRLTNLGTEKSEPYPTWILHIPMGVGLKYRVSSRIELGLELLAKYTFSDYLDDVSGKYRTSYDDEFQAYAGNPGDLDLKNHPDRGNPNGANDWYMFPSLTIGYHFGVRFRKFKAPVIMVSEGFAEQKPVVAYPPVTRIEGQQAEEIEPEPLAAPDSVDLMPAKEADEVLPQKEVISLQDTLLQNSLSYDTLRTSTSPNDSLQRRVNELQNELNSVLQRLAVLEQGEKDTLAITIPAKAEGDSLIVSRTGVAPGGESSQNLESQVEKLSLQLSVIQAQNEALLANSRNAEPSPQTTSVPATATPPANDPQLEAIRNEIAGLNVNSNSGGGGGAATQAELAAMNQKMNAMDAKLTTLLVGGAVAGVVGGGKNKKMRKEVEELNAEIALLRTQLAVVPIPSSTTSDSTLLTDSLGVQVPDSLALMSGPQIDEQTLILLQLNEKMLLLTEKLDSLQVYDTPDTVFISTGGPSFTDALAQDSLLKRPEIAGIQKANIYFKRGSFEVHPTDQLTLNALAAQLLKYPNMKVSVSGYADNLTGTAQRNQSLSEKRARSVEQYLLQRGVAQHQIRVQAFGDRVPVYGGVLDRRVEIELHLEE